MNKLIVILIASILIAGCVQTGPESISSPQKLKSVEEGVKASLVEGTPLPESAFGINVTYATPTPTAPPR